MFYGIYFPHREGKTHCILSYINLFSLAMDGSTDDSVTKSGRKVEIESKREIQSNREGERDSDENRDESDVDSDDENDSESECEQSEDETF